MYYVLTKFYTFSFYANYFNASTRLLNVRSRSYSKNKRMHSFCLTDYDCIGFDLDNTIARYKVGAMIEMEYDIIARFLTREKNYSKFHLLQPVDRKFMLKGLILDNKNGNILRISKDGEIIMASHGTRLLSNKEILNYYPNRHWELTDKFIEDPMSTWNGPYSEQMRPLLDYFDMAACLAFARIIDSLDAVKAPQQDYNVWPDLLSALKYMFDRDNYERGTGEYFAEIRRQPDKYYYKCSEKLRAWLKSLHASGKRLFLVTGANVDFASHTSANTLGPDWRDFFDVVVCYARKPGFFASDRDFYLLDGYTEVSTLSGEQLQLGAIYNQGNWLQLRHLLESSINNSTSRFLYVGDNFIQDIYVPSVLKCCDTIAICEELNLNEHPDADFLYSPLWGSYFECNRTKTNWYHIMQQFSRFAVPSLEDIAKFPINHEFMCHQ